MSSSDQNTSSDWTPPTVEELHTLLPQYEVSEVLGQGGMGAVYKGRQTKLKRSVAIKILPESLRGEGEGKDSDPHEFVEQFKLEAQSMANLDHPAIVSVYDFGETSGGQLYLVMEFIDGMDIEKYLHHHGGKLLPEHAIAITAHVLDALQYAHDHGVIHRDIKPANVLINSEGRVKIADFGLAKRLTHADDAGGKPGGKITTGDLVMGTPDFVAPESLEIGSNPDGRADLYSVGVMFYQMLTGKVPRGQFELPSRLQLELDSRFDAVVSRALQANPDRRYGSAAEFRRDLDGLLSRPVPKTADTKSGTVPAASKGKRVPVQSRLPYPRPKLAERKKSKAPLVVGLVLGAMMVIGVGIFAAMQSSSGKGQDGAQIVTPSKPDPLPAPPPEPKPIVVPQGNPAPSPPDATAKSDPPKVDTPGPEMPPVTVAKSDPPGSTAPDLMPADPRAALAAIPGLEPRLEIYLKTRREQVGGLAGKYLGGLETRLSQAANAGDLKLVRAYEAEKARVAGLQQALDEPPSDLFSAVVEPVPLSGLPAGTPESITTLRVTWDTERQKIRDDLDGKLSLSLQALEAELTKVRAFDEAEAIMAYRESLAGQEMENALGMKLCWIPAGKFTMGSPQDEAGRNPKEAQVDVELTRGFWIGKFEVTQEEYEEVMGNNPAKFKDVGKKAPVEMVNWNLAIDFCKKLTERERKKDRLPEGWSYQLPTEAQWEYACRAGEEGPYSGGEVDEVAWYIDNSGGKTHEVGEKKANPWGLHDMHGNVMEWCQDWAAPYPSGSATDPQGAASSSNRIRRGGCWKHGATSARSAFRSSHVPRATYYDTGFRVVLAPSAVIAESSPKPSPASALPAASGAVPREGSELAGRSAGQEMVNALGMKLCWIPAGKFTMGSPEDEAGRHPQEAQVDVELTRGFWIGKFEVTQEEYEEVMGANPAKFKDVGKKAPVEMVNWNLAIDFCKQLTERERRKDRLTEGWNYQLPTEAQWEHASRAGEKGPYSGGKLDEVAWYIQNSGGKTHEVGEKKANPWGLHDMLGNLWEWCQDWAGPYPSGSVTDPRGPASGPGRVRRGGSWKIGADRVRCADRSNHVPGATYGDTGFRVVLVRGQP